MDSDGFWNIELQGDQRSRRSLEETSSDEDDYFVNSSQRYISYMLPYQKNDYVRLRLRPLALSDGVFSPLGSQAWYGSAILASLLLCSDGRVQRHLRQFDVFESMRVLELGSGAVGLSGLTMALILSGRGARPRFDELVLSDNNHQVLEQLQRNVDSTVKRLQEENASIQMPKITVRHLDWNEDNAFDFKNGLFHLVIGSELVYELHGGMACARCVSSLLERNQNLLIIIIQVTDRDGWNNVFIPELQQSQDIIIEQEVVPADCDEVASQLIPHGGSLDRFDFGVCYIYHRNRNV